jgi:hypothetical protein
VTNGDISPDRIFKVIENGSVDEKLNMLIEIQTTQSKTCKTRQCECDKRYVSKIWWKSKLAGLFGLSAGMGLSIDKIKEWFFK